MTVEVKQFTRADTPLEADSNGLRNNSWHSTPQTPGTFVNSQDLHAVYNIRDKLSVSHNLTIFFALIISSSSMPFVNLLSTSPIKVVKALPKPNSSSAKRFGLRELMVLLKSYLTIASLAR